MSTAVIDLCTDKLLVTTCAPEILESGKHFPENLVPRHLFLSQKHYEFVDIPMLIRLMLCHNTSIEVYEDVGFWALKPFSLVAGIQSAAVGATMNHVVLFLKKKL
jgi:hypothetical protein